MFGYAFIVFGLGRVAENSMKKKSFRVGRLDSVTPANPLLPGQAVLRCGKGERAPLFAMKCEVSTEWEPASGARDPKGPAGLWSRRGRIESRRIWRSSRFSLQFVAPKRFRAVFAQKQPRIAGRHMEM
jgi:hypothetical protein